MTISTTTTCVAYTGDGVATAFAVPFPFFAADELEVIERDAAAGTETLRILGSHYTVAGGDGAAGTVTATSAPSAAVQWVIRRRTARVQETDYTPNDPFPADTHEKALDRLTMIGQELGEDSDRALKFPKTDAAALDPTLPVSSARAGRVLAFGEDGAPTVSTKTLVELESGATDAAASAVAALASQNAAATSAAVAAGSQTAAATSATAASASAAAAEAAAASVGFSDVVFVTAAQSPMTIAQASSGKLYNCDTSGGSIVVNLPQISGLALPFTVGIKKSTGDANTVSINRAGTDLFDDGTALKQIASVHGTTLIPDLDPNPDTWTAADWAGAAIADNSIANAKLAQMPAATLKGNDSGATANAADLTVAQVRTMLGIGAATPPVVGFRKLGISGAPSGKTCSWSVDEIVVETALGGTAYKGASKIFAFNGVGTGANGMDTGPTPTSGDLYVYAIYNPTTDTWACLGTVAGSGADIYAGSNMPSGYTASALIWSGKTDGSGNFVAFTQRDRKVWTALRNVLTGGTATTYTSVSLSGVVPANAVSVSGVMGNKTTATNLGVVIASDASGTAAQYGVAAEAGGFTMDGYGGAGVFTDLPTMTAQMLYYRTYNASSSISIDITGYKF